MNRTVCGLIMIILLAACAAQPTPFATLPGQAASEAPPTEIATEEAATEEAPRGECGPAEDGEVAMASILVPGPINGLEASPAKGERLVLIVTVVDADCNPAEGASVDVWHTDAEGLYGPVSGSSSDIECCYYGGTIRSDSNGRFLLNTIRPAPYQNNLAPAHIHMEISHFSGGLMTEIVFEGDPKLPPNADQLDGYVVVRLSQDSDDAGMFWFAVAKVILN